MVTWVTWVMYYYDLGQDIKFLARQVRRTIVTQGANMEWTTLGSLCIY